MRRRDVLVSVGVLSGTLLAGCVSGDTADETDEGGAGETDEETDEGEVGETDEDGDETNGDTDDGEVSADSATLEIVDTEIETTDSDCLTISADEDPESPWDSDWTVVDDTVVISGTRQAPNPCHETVLADAAVSDQEVRITVDVERTEGVCPDCVASIDYEARIELTDAEAIESVDVTHAE